MIISNPTAFDAFAAAYDDDFTHSTLGQLLRPRVWEKLAQYFTAGQHVLELTCGTGEDAVWLAQRGVHVTATDGSAEMVQVAKAKAEVAGVQRSRGAGETNGAGSVEVKQVSLQQVMGGYFQSSGVEASVEDNELDSANPKGDFRTASTSKAGLGGRRSAVGGRLFDGVFSNFGGLNTIGEWRPLAVALAKIVKPGGIVILVPMGPFCPWEILWYLGHGQPKQAWRRLAQKGIPAQIGDALIPIWYPSAQRLRADFSPWFQHRHTESLELWLPPSYLDHFVNRWPGFFRQLNQFEKATAGLTGGWGDHYIIVFERK